MYIGSIDQLSLKISQQIRVEPLNKCYDVQGKRIKRMYDNDNDNDDDTLPKKIIS